VTEGVRPLVLHARHPVRRVVLRPGAHHAAGDRA
jgi:hypothetical protein